MRLCDSLSQEFARKQRGRLYLYQLVKFSPNIQFMDHLLDFIEERFGLLPRQSPSGLICFRPQFTAFVSATKTKGGLHVSLFGKGFTKPTERAKWPNWRKYVVTAPDYLPIAEQLIEEAHEKRNSFHISRLWTFEDERSTTKEFRL